MKINLTILCVLVSVICSCSPDRQVRSLNGPKIDAGWLFFRGDHPEGGDPLLDDSGWGRADLPHDWSIEDIPGTSSPFDPDVVNGVASGFTRGGTGWYRKHLRLESQDSGKQVMILFEGIYMDSEVWVNGTRTGDHFYGYSSFLIDITSLARFGTDNLVAVRVNNEGARCRWYPGSGIYRHVRLQILDPLHIAPWGISVTTPELSPEKARVIVTLTLVNRGGADQAGKVHLRIMDPGGKEAGSAVAGFDAAPGTITRVNREIVVREPLLWDTETPRLYTLEAKVETGGRTTDRTALDFGIRSISMDAVNGFRLNGRSLELKGGCIHHDNGPLGACAFDRAEQRKIELLKSAGFNAIRFAHNPPSPAILDACDRLGMLAIVESFDVWRYGHYEDDYSTRFDSLWKTDIENMVLRDRNHPSVILWSIGNEITRAETGEIADLCGQITRHVRSLDPTRPVTAALNAITEQKDPFFSHLDACGYNYSADRYRYDHERLPGRVMYGSESKSTEAAGYWRAATELPWVIGDFVWTAFDYMGEASIGWLGYMLEDGFYPWYVAYCGDFDITGQRRPQSWYRQTIWDTLPVTSLFVVPPEPSFPLNPLKEEWSTWDWPDVIPSWNFPGYKDSLLRVVVYSNCQEVELSLDGSSLGRKCNTPDTGNILSWIVPFREGRLTAAGFREGRIVSESVLESAGEPAAIRLTADRNELRADGQDLAYIRVEVVDTSGVRHPWAEVEVGFEISGAGVLAATGSGDPTSVESFQQPRRSTWRGECLLIARAGRTPGDLHVRAHAGGMPDASLVIKVE